VPIQSPYAATLSAVRNASTIRHRAYSWDRDLIVCPIKLVLTAGALTTQQCTHRVYVTDQGSGVMRLHIPPCQPDNVALTIGSALTNTVAVDYSTAASGYIQVTFSTSPSATYSGVLFIRNHGRPVVGNVTNGSIPAALPKSPASKGLYPLKGMVPDLAFFWVTFTIDASSDPVGSTTAEGMPQFNVTHDGVGAWTVNTNIMMNSSWVFLVANEVAPMAGALGGDGKSISLSRATDPGASTVRILAIGSVGVTGVRKALAVPVAATKSRVAENYPAFSLMRDAIISPFRWTHDGSGNVPTTGAYHPQSVKVQKSTGDLRLDIGTATSALTQSWLRTNAQASFLGSKTNLESQGRIQFTLGGALASTHLQGVICSANGARRG
jgi:hypothetical protein